MPAPDFLMEHFIPENKDIPEHYHIDINYVVEIAEQELKNNIKESHNIGWFTKD